MQMGTATRTGDYGMKPLSNRARTSVSVCNESLLFTRGEATDYDRAHWRVLRTDSRTDTPHDAGIAHWLCRSCLQESNDHNIRCSVVHSITVPWLSSLCVLYDRRTCAPSTSIYYTSKLNNE
jgi:hypothetical protein